MERRQIKTLDIPMVKSAVQERLNRREECRRATLRLKPDISALHKILLSWSYDHVGPEPPGEKLKRIHVPDKFADYAEYRRVFEPLLLLECWSQIVQAKDESPDVYDCRVASRAYSDDWLDLDITIPGPVRKDWYLAETDVILLRHIDGKRSIMAKTASYRAMHTGIQASLKCYIQGASTDPGLQINTSWRLHKIFRHAFSKFA